MQRKKRKNEMDRRREGKGKKGSPWKGWDKDERGQLTRNTLGKPSTAKTTNNKNTEESMKQKKAIALPRVPIPFFPIFHESSFLNGRVRHDKDSALSHSLPMTRLAVRSLFVHLRDLALLLICADLWMRVLMAVAFHPERVRRHQHQHGHLH